MSFYNLCTFSFIIAISLSSHSIQTDSLQTTKKIIDLQKIDLPETLQKDLKPSKFISREMRGEVIRELGLTEQEYEEIRDEQIRTADLTSVEIIGAVFWCNPYCSFIQMLINPGFLVDMPDEINMNDVRFIDSQSDSFKAYFSEIDKQQALLDAIVLQKKLRALYNEAINSSSEAAKKKSLNFYYALGLGISQSSINLSTNSILLSDLKSPHFLSYLSRLDLASSYFIKVNTLKLYPQLFYSLNQTIDRTSSETGAQVESNSTAYGVNFYIPKNKWNSAFGYYLKTIKNSHDTQSIQGFDQSYTISGLNLNVGYNYFKLYYQFSLSINGNDSQSYRSAPYTAKENIIGLEYCSQKFDDVWIKAMYCADLSATTFNQESGIASNLSLNIDRFEQKERVLKLALSIKFGRDFNQVFK